MCSKAQSEGIRNNGNKLQQGKSWLNSEKKKNFKKNSPEIRIALGQGPDWWVQYNYGNFQKEGISLKTPRGLIQHKFFRDSLGIQQVEFLNFWHACIIIALRVYGFSEVQLGVFHTAHVPSDGTPAMYIRRCWRRHSDNTWSLAEWQLLIAERKMLSVGHPLKTKENKS